VCELLQHAMSMVPAVSKHHNGLPDKGKTVVLDCLCEFGSFLVCDGELDQFCPECESVVYGSEGCGLWAICCTSNLPDAEDDATHRATTKLLCR
jgi:hypothetical protein